MTEHKNSTDKIVNKSTFLTDDRPRLILTRHLYAEPDPFDPVVPRLGRRESEPHSMGITYIHDVLTTNFPDSRTLWDLHHYFRIEEPFRDTVDIQFDVSFFKGWKFPYTLSSYRASEFDNRIPDMAINIMSKSTWRADLLDHVDYCRLIRIPVYIVFAAYHVADRLYEPPFLRAYILKGDDYEIRELRDITLREGDAEMNTRNVIDFGGRLPFRVGLMELKRRHVGDLKLYTAVFLEPDADRLLKTRVEKERERAEREKERADKLEALLKRYREKFGDLASTG